MAGRLKRIVDYVRSKAYLKNLTVSRINMRMDMDVNSFTEDTPDDPQLEARLIEAAKEILKTDKLDIPE